VLTSDSVGCGDSKVAVSKEVYKLFEDTLVAKEKAESMLKLYTNTVSSPSHVNKCFQFLEYRTGLSSVLRDCGMTRLRARRYLPTMSAAMVLSTVPIWLVC
jgi:hypothetical protein